MTGWLDGADVSLPPAAPAAGKASTFGEMFDAARQSYDAVDLSTTRNYYAGRLGSEIVRDLKKRGVVGQRTPMGTVVPFDDDILRTDNPLHPYVAPTVFAAVKAEQAKDPSFHPEITGAEAFEAAIVKARGADYREAQQVLASGGGVSGFLASTAGSLTAAVQDPLQIGIGIVSAPVGGELYSLAASRLGITAASSFAKRVALGAASDAAVNVLATAPTLPVRASHLADIGEDYGLGDAAADLGVAGLFGGALHLGVAGAGRAVKFAWEGGERTFTPRTPAEADAARVIEAEQATIHSSPFVDTPAGDAAHAQRLQAAADALDRDAPPPAFEGEPAPLKAKKPADVRRIGIDFDGEPLVGGETYRIDARALGVDPERFQFKSGGDAKGVTGTLDVSQWSDEQSGKLLVWQDEAGKLWVVNGHQRTGKANQLMAAGHAPIEITATVLREADGITAQEAMVRGAIVNIGENSTTPLLDAAKVARHAPGRLDGRVPMRVARAVGGLAKLSDDAWGMVRNGTLDPGQASLIGQIAPDPRLHAPLVALLHETKPATLREAEFTIRDALSAGSTTEEQLGLFGTDAVQTLLVKRRAQIVSRALAQLRADKRFTAAAVAGEQLLTGIGNTLDRAANASATVATEQLLTVVERLATMRGNFVNEALREATEQAAREGSNGNATKLFVERLRAHPDLVGDALAGAEAAGLRGGDGGPAGPSALDAGLEGSPAGRAAAGLDQGADAAADADAGPGFLDPVTAAHGERGLAAFDDPRGQGARDQADGIAHDLRAEAELQQSMSEDGEPAPAVDPSAMRQQGFGGTAAEIIAAGDDTRPLTGHPQYEAAKHGDAAAAAQVAVDIAGEPMLDRVAAAHPGATFVPVVKAGGGRNAIPLALAHELAARAQGKLDTNIVQATRPGRTGAGLWERMVSRAGFDGEVTPGARYVIVDDVITLGGTVAELADHIRRGGGEVAGVVTLADRSGNHPLAARAADLEAIAEKGLDSVIRERLGIEPAALTGVEANRIASIATPDRLRTLLDKGMGERDGGRADGPARKESGELDPVGGEGALDVGTGAGVDPAIADRARLETQLRADSPMRGPQGQADLADTGLFGQVDMFALPEGGSGRVADLLDGFDRDQAALDALRGCL